MCVKCEITDYIAKKISALVKADGKTVLGNNFFWTGLVGSAKFGDLVKFEEPQLSDTFLAVKEILTWDLTFATSLSCLKYVFFQCNHGHIAQSKR